MRSITSTATIKKLREIFATHGLSETIVSDKGGNFTSAEFEKCLAGNGIKHTKVSSYHPASNGPAERAVRAFKDGVEKMEAGYMLGKLSRFLLNHRSDPHSTTGLSPAEFLMKRRLRTKLDLVRPHTARRVRRKQQTQKKAQDGHAKDRHFEISVPVYIRESTQGRRQRQRQHQKTMI